MGGQAWVLQSSFVLSLVAGLQLEASTSPVLVLQTTVRVLVPPPQATEQLDQAPANQLATVGLGDGLGVALGVGDPPGPQT